MASLFEAIICNFQINIEIKDVEYFSNSIWKGTIKVLIHSDRWSRNMLI
jgi:hypothetical protein